MAPQFHAQDQPALCKVSNNWHLGRVFTPTYTVQHVDSVIFIHSTAVFDKALKVLYFSYFPTEEKEIKDKIKTYAKVLIRSDSPRRL